NRASHTGGYPESTRLGHATGNRLVRTNSASAVSGPLGRIRRLVVLRRRPRRRIRKHPPSHRRKLARHRVGDSPHNEDSNTQITRLILLTHYSVGSILRSRVSSIASGLIIDAIPPG